jgi:hypothetical protein
MTDKELMVATIIVWCTWNSLENLKHFLVGLVIGFKKGLKDR